MILLWLDPSLQTPELPLLPVPEAVRPERHPCPRHASCSGFLRSRALATSPQQPRRSPPGPRSGAPGTGPHPAAPGSGARRTALPAPRAATAAAPLPGAAQSPPVRALPTRAGSAPPPALSRLERSPAPGRELAGRDRGSCPCCCRVRRGRADPTSAGDRAHRPPSRGLRSGTQPSANSYNEPRRAGRKAPKSGRQGRVTNRRGLERRGNKQGPD